MIHLRYTWHIMGHTEQGRTPNSPYATAQACSIWGQRLLRKALQIVVASKFAEQPLDQWKGYDNLRLLTHTGKVFEAVLKTS